MQDESGGVWRPEFPEVVRAYMSPPPHDFKACEGLPILSSRYGILVLTPLELQVGSQCTLSSETHDDSSDSNTGRVATISPLEKNVWANWVSWPHSIEAPIALRTPDETGQQPEPDAGEHKLLLVSKSSLQRQAWKNLANTLGYDVATTTFGTSSIFDEIGDCQHVLVLANTAQEADEMIGYFWFDTSGKSYSKSILCAELTEHEATQRESATGIHHLTKPFDIDECQGFLRELTSAVPGHPDRTTTRTTAQPNEDALAFECEIKTLLQGVVFMLFQGKIELAMDVLHTMSSRSRAMGLETIATMCRQIEMELSADMSENRRLLKKLGEQIDLIHSECALRDQASAA
jgi:hypothetical protein